MLTKSELKKTFDLSLATVALSLLNVSVVRAEHSDAGVDVHPASQQSSQPKDTTTITNQQRPLITIDQGRMPMTGSAPSWGFTVLGLVLLLCVVLYHFLHGKKKPREDS